MTGARTTATRWLRDQIIAAVREHPGSTASRGRDRLMADPTPTADYGAGLFTADPAVRKDAAISECGRYRYTLHRWWEPDRTRLGFIMLNPSTADADADDPTIRRCLGFARALGCDGIRVFNLYAFRATKPADLWKADEPTGGDRNDDLLREVLRQAKHWPVIAAWGANAKPDRVAEVMSWRGSEHLLALGLTKDGAPRHPLYLRADAEPIPFGSTRVTPPGSDQEADRG